MPVIYNRLPKIAAAARPLAEAAVARSAFATEAWAKGIAPVDTGNLRNSISAAAERELTWRITAHAEYAIYVEMPTRHTAAQPFLEPALRQGTRYLEGALKVFA